MGVESGMAKTLGDVTRELRENVLGPARAEADKIVAAAHKEAETVLAKAGDEAEKLRLSAVKEAEDLRARMEADLQTAARNFVLKVQERIEEAVVKPSVDEEVRKVFADTDFFKKVIEAAVTAFSKNRDREQKIELVLPEKQRAELQGWFTGRFTEKVSQEIEVCFSEKISFGFQIGVKGEGARYNFSSGLTEAFAAFCSPRFRKYFFSGKTV
jgi:V/A-type H+-transporting ATPase subunit E